VFYFIDFVPHTLLYLNICVNHKSSRKKEIKITIALHMLLFQNEAFQTIENVVLRRE
jgi:hypothetical protein